MLEERLKSILELVVREYIRTAEPISSERIASRMNHSLSPASIRNIFSELTHEKYIEQPHVSGGRVPMARAYRFFVDELIAGETRRAALPAGISRLLGELEGERELQEEIARHFHVISRFGDAMPVGFDNIFRQPEFSEPMLIRDFGKFLDSFDDYHDDYAGTLEPETFSVFIGNENPFQPADGMSMAIGKSYNNELFFIAGPTRMQYDHIISIMNLWKKKPKM